MSEEEFAGDSVFGGITDEEECPYLPGRFWRNWIIDTRSGLTPAVHEALLNRNFRRMGEFFYRPMCPGCSECRSLRVDTERFTPSKSLRRIRRRNDDLDISITGAEYTEEKRELLERYLDARHVGPMTAEESSTERFMFRSSADTRGMSYRLDGRLVGYGLVDLTNSIVSSLYFFFDPAEEHRSMGFFSMMVEIDFAREQGRRWYHPGFFIEHCPSMSYKSRMGPAEILHEDGVWRSCEA